MSAGFRLLVLADSHYDAEGKLPTPEFRYDLGCELIRRAMEDAKRRGGFDAIAMLGDVLAEGDSPRFEDELSEIANQIDAAAGEVPLMVAPGNHDRLADELLAAFGTRAGVHEIGGYRFVVFADSYGAEGRYCTRSCGDLALLRELGGQSGGPIVTLQHNPISPEVDCSEYPYMHTNRCQIMADYSRAGVMLSLSGHYHPGQPLNVAGGVRYFTMPILCEAPFPYTLITLRGREVTVETRPLQLDGSPRVVDSHVHTEFSYCAQREVDARTAIRRARTFGASGICLVEHAPQIYCRPEDFWAARHIHQPDIWRSETHSRMAAFGKEILPLRNSFVRVGLEVELDAAGAITLHDRDRRQLDLVVGAVHWLAEDNVGLTDAQAAEAFMRTTEKLLTAGVDILAHPWRYFLRADRPVPVDLYPDLADLLAATQTAAEINFHANMPDPAFFAQCIDRGVKIALGSDTHASWEVVGLVSHIEVLRQAASSRDLADLLLY